MILPITIILIMILSVSQIQIIIKSNLICQQVSLEQKNKLDKSFIIDWRDKKRLWY